MRRISPVMLLAAALLTAGLSFAPPARADGAPVYTGFLSALAVGGYDPVAYFTDAGPVEGSATFESEYQGATWRFASAANKTAFDADPQRYAPLYGGYCAWAVSQGYTAKGDPAHWRIVDGRLYLNYDAAVQRMWEQDIPANIAAADAKWPKVLK